MDIVSRIKQFMASIGLSSSQLADTCDIPRPTMSQILNGRSKKISDDLISRLHTNFPQLSIMWLLFGEGDMLNSENIKTSEPEGSQKHNHKEAQGADNQINFSDNSFEFHASDQRPEKSDTRHGTFFDGVFEQHVGFDNIKRPVHHQTSNTSTNNRQPERVSDMPEAIGNLFGSLSPQADQPTSSESRSVSAIMVFYSDNSYEMFTPSSNK